MLRGEIKIIIEDILYGEHKVDSVLADLIKSKSVQRLKKVRQSGANFLINKKYNKVSRYDHSIGVMILTRKMGGSIEEQIAGLLHDVSHTAFSHVSDLLFTTENTSSYHEQIYIEFIAKTDIPRILDKHGYNYKEILFDLTKWKLLEQPMPLLSIDRIDYTLRDMVVYEDLSLNEVNNFLNNLIVFKNKLCLKDVKSGEWFLNIYFKEVVGFFMNPENVYSHIILKDVLKYALELGIINKNDFLKTDDYILEKLYQSNSLYIKNLFKKIEQTQVTKSSEHDYNYFLNFKVRQINPYILIDGKLIELSLISNKAKQMLANMINHQNAGVYIKEINYGDK